jgi:hypothetical protein
MHAYKYIHILKQFLKEKSRRRTPRVQRRRGHGICSLCTGLNQHIAYYYTSIQTYMFYCDPEEKIIGRVTTTTFVQPCVHIH